MNPMIRDNNIIAKFLLCGDNTVNVIFIISPTFPQQVDALLRVIRQGYQIGDVVGL